MSELEIPPELVDRIAERRTYPAQGDRYDEDMRELYAHVRFLKPHIVKCLKIRLGAVKHTSVFEDSFELPDEEDIGFDMGDTDHFTSDGPNAIMSSRKGREAFLADVLKYIETCANENPLLPGIPEAVKQRRQKQFVGVMTGLSGKIPSGPAEIVAKMAVPPVGGRRKRKTRKNKKASKKTRKVRRSS